MSCALNHDDLVRLTSSVLPSGLPWSVSRPCVGPSHNGYLTRLGDCAKRNTVSKLYSAALIRLTSISLPLLQ